MQYNKGVYISYYLPFDFVWFYLPTLHASIHHQLINIVKYCLPTVYGVTWTYFWYIS